MPSETIQWFPGHMAKTRRMISENLKNVDIVIEILDARIPYSSRNPEIVRLTEGKPTLLLLNKASLADPNQNKLWLQRYTNENTKCLLSDCVTGEGLNRMEGAIKEILADKAGLEAQMKKGAEEASYYARRTLGKVQKKLGFVKL